MSDTFSCERCSWAQTDPLMRDYHDAEWGVPQCDPRMLWEMLMLEGFQAGLSWITILRKREAFRAAFADFDPAKVAAFGEGDVERLMADPGIVRARAKIQATIQGAQSTAACKIAARTSRNSAGLSREVRLSLVTEKAG